MSTGTFEEIKKIEEREALLDREIIERQKLKEAYRLVREDLAQHNRNGASPEPDVATMLLVPHHGDSPKEKEYGGNTRLVRQAISKMPGDYTIREIHYYLRGHGFPLGMNAIATVLNRLKKNNEIHVRRFGMGRRPTLFKR